MCDHNDESCGKCCGGCPPLEVDLGEMKLIPGPVGPRGPGISGAHLNPDYTLTLTFEDGSSYTTPPIRSERGETPRVGPNGNWFLGDVDTGVPASRLVDSHTGRELRFWFGTLGEYNALTRVEPDVYYNILEGKP